LDSEGNARPVSLKTPKSRVGNTTFKAKSNFDIGSPEDMSSRKMTPMFHGQNNIENVAELIIKENSGKLIV
jgi:hypothetical protein